MHYHSSRDHLGASMVILSLERLIFFVALGITREAVALLNSLPDKDAINTSSPTEVFFPYNWSVPISATEDDHLWMESIERGTKLLQGMQSSDTEAGFLFQTGETAESPFDGDLKDKLREWGYNDNTLDL